jgi:hypothetical protein
LGEQATRILGDAFSAKAVVKRKSGSYNANSLTITLIITPGKKGDVHAGEREAFASTAMLIGLKPEHYGEVITVNSKKVKITGISLRKRKFPVEVEEVNTGAKMFTTPAVVLSKSKLVAVVGKSKLACDKPEKKAKKMCKYCHERPADPYCVGACNTPKCVRASMRDSL